MKKDKVLINFQIPVSMKERFDRYCEITGKSKTSVLQFLIEEHLISQVSDIEQKVNRLAMLDNQIVRHSRIIRFKEFIQKDKPT